ncbi:MAG: hypothetical protein PHE67_11985, partial [Campylobacterales bacterium]|nr:hypothetical protein [Campylobacterales bacterium]
CWLFVSASKDGAIGEVSFELDDGSDFVVYDAGYQGNKIENNIDLYKKYGYYGTYPAFVCSYFLENFKGKAVNFISNGKSFSLKVY